MAKNKFEIKKIIEIVGMLDKDEDGNYVIFVEEVPYDLGEILEEMAGKEVSFKSTDEVVQ